MSDAELYITRNMKIERKSGRVEGGYMTLGLSFMSMDYSTAWKKLKAKEESKTC